MSDGRAAPVAIEERLQIHDRCSSCADYLARLSYADRHKRKSLVGQAETHLRRDHRHGVGLH